LLSVAKSGARFTQDASNELEIGKILTEADPEGKFKSRLNLMDDFIIKGPNGSHQAAVFILVGPNLDKWVKQVIFNSIFYFIKIFDQSNFF
jgi:hypothetical protein